MKDYIGFKSSTYSKFHCSSPKHGNVALELHQSVTADEIHQAGCTASEMMPCEVSKAQSLSKMLSYNWGANVKMWSENWDILLWIA